MEGFQAFMALLTAGINLYLCQGKITHSMLIGEFMVYVAMAIFNITSMLQEMQSIISLRKHMTLLCALLPFLLYFTPS